MAPATREELLDLCRSVLQPLIEADRGWLYVVDAEEDQLTLHLDGACAGCPGATHTIRSVIEPTVRALSGTAKVVVTVGARRPVGARSLRDVDGEPDGGSGEWDAMLARLEEPTD